MTTSQSVTSAVLDRTQIKNVVAITACPSGVTQTFMAAEAIMLYAKQQGWNIKVETRGQLANNSSNALTESEISQADLVFVAADIDVDLSAFKGKPVYKTSTKAALKNTAQEFEQALNSKPAVSHCPHCQAEEEAISCTEKACPVNSSTKRTAMLALLAVVVAIAVYALS